MSEIQRYHPTTNMTEDRLFQVLMDEIVGGDYVLFTDHEAAIAAAIEAERNRKILTRCECQDVRDLMARAEIEAYTENDVKAMAHKMKHLEADKESNARLVEELTRERDGLRKALSVIPWKPEYIRQMMRERGIVIADHNDPMQKFAFTLYSIIVNLAAIAQDALKDAQEGEHETP